MKKIITVVLALGMFLGSLAQTYTSSNMEILDGSGNVLDQRKVDFKFVVDTAGRVLTAIDNEEHKTLAILLVKKSDHVVKSNQFKVWGYTEVKTSGSIKLVSFTEYLSGKLFSLNFYNEDGLILVFYIKYHDSKLDANENSFRTLELYKAQL
jgi:predicted GTPase